MKAYPSNPFKLSDLRFYLSDSSLPFQAFPVPQTLRALNPSCDSDTFMSILT